MKIVNIAGNLSMKILNIANIVEKNYKTIIRLTHTDKEILFLDNVKMFGLDWRCKMMDDSYRP